MKKAVAVLGMWVSISYSICAQDPHFSQFFVSPLTLNPALTGKFDGPFRVAGNYRNQWPALNNVYTTSTLSVDFNLLNKKSTESDTWGLGVLVLTDKAGGGVLTNNYIGLSTAYHKLLDENGSQQIGIGFQGVYGQKRLDNSKLFFEDQLTSLGFTGVTQDIFNNENLSIHYLDMNAGLLYSLSTRETNNFYVGASLYHINRPKESFKGGDWNMGMRTTIHAGGYFPVSDLLTLHTSGICQLQAKAMETVIGGALAATPDPSATTPSTVYGGLWYRYGDAIIPYLGWEFGGLRLGATYDITMSGLRTGAQSRGGLEISLIYVNHPAPYKGIPCPKF